MTWTIQGHWYDGQHSGQYGATLLVSESGEVVVSANEGAAELFSGQFAALRISNRLGNTARYLYFPDEQKFETRDNDLVDQLAKQLSPNAFWGWVHRFETRWHYVLFALVAFVIFSFGAVKYGVPAASKVIAYTLPDELAKRTGRQTMATLDKYYLDKSNLPDSVQQRLLAHFAPVIKHHPDLDIRVLFRDGGAMGANAFALPDGTVVFTDQMVDLALHDDELLSVMAHEVGHVAHQHSMRGIVQGSLLGFMLLLITGDSTGVAEALLSIPVLLTELGYSRNFEREADDHAYNYMEQHGIEHIHFANLMQRLERHFSCGSDVVRAGQPADKKAPERAETPTSSDESDDKIADDCEVDTDKWQQYMSTHPAMAERIEQFSQ